MKSPRMKRQPQRDGSRPGSRRSTPCHGRPNANPHPAESTPLGRNSVALHALQFLPVALLVLSAQETIVLANEAMAVFLKMSDRQHGTAGALLGKPLNTLGIEVFSEDSNQLMPFSLGSILESLAEHARSTGSEFAPASSPPSRFGDIKRVVHVPHWSPEMLAQRRPPGSGPVRLSEMTISPWKGDHGEMHFTATFLGAWQWEPTHSEPDGSCRTDSLSQKEAAIGPPPVVRPVDSLIEGIILGSRLAGGRKNNRQQPISAREAEFRKMCDCMPRMVCAAIWTTLLNGDHDYFSKSWYDFTGLTPEHCLGGGNGWQESYYPDDLSVVNEKWEHSLATGDSYSAEYRLRRRDGELRWMLGRVQPLRDPDTGKVLKWYGTATDIHDIVVARIAENATREQLSEALTHAEITLWSIDRDRKFTLLEGGIVWQTRDNPSYYLGKDIREVFDEVDPDDPNHRQFLEPIEPLLRGEISEGFTTTQLDNHWFRTKYVPTRKGAGGKNSAEHVTGIIGLSMDVTKMHATELELRERERQNRVLQANENAAKQASKLKSDFLASMSHEIRTPIAGVVGMCEILLGDTELSSEQRELAEGIQRSAHALLTVINDILDLSKVESGKMDIEEVQFNLPLLIRDVVKMLSFEAERKNLGFTHEIKFPSSSSGEDLIVMGDPGRVRQILANLLSNALKFTHEGSVDLRASAKREDEEKIEIHFVVNDTGIGIIEADQRRLFQPFTQADSSTARKFGGTGLGLSICQKLVFLMHGQIGLSSSAGKGTSAYFTVPFKKARSGQLLKPNFDSIPERLQSDTSVKVVDPNTPPDSPKKHQRLPPPPPPERAVSPPRPSLPNLSSDMEARRKCHVLVVDDNEINQQIAIRLIKKLNFTVSAVCNGLECLEFLKNSIRLPPTSDDGSGNTPSQRRPDVILMDVQMPEMDGYAATRAIRSGQLSPPPPLPTSPTSSPPDSRPVSPEGSGTMGWLGSLPIVALTASAIKGDRELCLRHGMSDYLSKPVHGHMLEKMLVKWCFRKEPYFPAGSIVDTCEEVGASDSP